MPHNDTMQYSVYSYALLQAAAQADMRAMAECLENGAHPDVSDPAGRTSLMLTCGRTSRAAKAVVELLLSWKASTACLDARNRCAAHEAASAGNAEALLLLKGAGAQLDTLDIDLNSPLHLTSSPHCAAILLQSGARCFIENRSGHTPLMEAVLRDDIPCIKTHIRYGARPLARNREGVNAASIAWDLDLHEVLNVLYLFTATSDESGELEPFDSWLRAALRGTPSDLSMYPEDCPTWLPEYPVVSDLLDGDAGSMTSGPSRPVTRPYFATSELEKALAAPMDDDRPKYLKKMQAAGHLRVLNRIPDTLSFSALRRDFPNFDKATDFLEREVALCRLAESKVAEFRPILLLGDPGVGKTRYLLEVSKLLALEFALIQCGDVSANFVLSGSTTSWKNGKPGKIHVTLRDGQSMNPIIVLDEIDKMTGSRDHDAHGPLYQLLERKTACCFQDECIEVPMDCSAVIWFATANQLGSIPEAIVSRLRVIDVPAPSGDGLLQVCRSVYRDILEEHRDTWGESFARELSDAVLACLGMRTPREIRKCLLSACGKAALRQDKDATLSRPISLTPADVQDAESSRKTIGFAS